MGTEAEGKREVEVVVGLVEAVEVVVEDTKTKEKMRTKNNWTGERKTILRKDDEETLSSKHLHGVFKEPSKADAE